MPADTSMPRVALILGAGFSREGNVPLQNEILASIRELNLSDAPLKLVPEFLQARNTTLEFVRRTFGNQTSPSLEDVFTLLDQTADCKQCCMGIAWRDLDTINRALCRAILYLFHIKERTISEHARTFYDSIGSHLLREICAARQKQKLIGVISLNWDCVLDNSIQRCLPESSVANAAVDYCCYSTPIPESRRDTPSMTKSPGERARLKLMKLHGSTNWLLCPNCSRLYTGLGADDDDWADYVLGKTCPVCGESQVCVDGLGDETQECTYCGRLFKGLGTTDDKNENGDELDGRCPRCRETQACIERLAGEGISPPELEPFLITPTFIKKFENPHIRMVWHNAFIELCRASKVVFIGYSLPMADYHLRTLFKRAIKPDAEILAVLADQDARPNGRARDGDSRDYTEDRYRDFFGSYAKLDFRFDGVKGYFGDLLGSQTSEQQIQSLEESRAETPSE